MEGMLYPYLIKWQEHKRQVEGNSAGLLAILGWSLVGVILRVTMLFFGAMMLRAGLSLDKDLSLLAFLVSSWSVWCWGLATIATLFAVLEIPQGKWPRVFFSILSKGFLLVLLLLFVVAFFAVSLPSGDIPKTSSLIIFWWLLPVSIWVLFLLIRLAEQLKGRRRLGWFLTSLSAFLLLCSFILASLSSLAIRIFELSVWIVPLAGFGIVAGILLYFCSLAVLYHYEWVKAEKEIN